MCLAIPMRITKIENDRATVNIGGVEREISIQTLTQTPQIGDFVIVHAGFAIEIIDEEKAQETLGLLAELEDSFEREN